MRDDDDSERFLIRGEHLGAGLTERIAAGAARPAEARPASTVVLARDGDEGIDVLMVRRPIGSRFAADAWVFPGGAVDEGDRDPRLREVLEAEQVEEWRERLGVVSAAEAVGYLAAAVRETWEETGILLADGIGVGAAARGRTTLLAGGCLADALVDCGIGLAVDRLVYLAHWITPTAETRRYDAKFFLASVGGEAECELVGGELEEWRWMRPAEAVAEFADDSIRLLPPTLHTLRLIAGFSTLDDLWHATRDAAVPTHRPTMRPVEGGVEIRL